MDEAEEMPSGRKGRQEGDTYKPGGDVLMDPLPFETATLAVDCR